MKKPNALKTDIHQEITDIIIAQLEKGTVPWHQPWKDRKDGLLKLPLNSVTGNRYKGINILMLWCSAITQEFTTNEWGSYQQWLSKGEQVKKGEKGTRIVYYDVIKKEKENGEIDVIPFVKPTTVFNKQQLESYIEPVEEELPAVPLFDNDDAIEKFVDNTGIGFVFHHKGAYYHRTEDKIYMPVRERFIDTPNCTAKEGFHATRFHEIVHATGAPQRLNRIKGKKFGDKEYAYEELVAELGSAFLCSKFDLVKAEMPSHASYIASWLEALKDNKTFIFAASSEASKAVEFLENLQPN